jgi:hypothetical protein
MFDVNIWMIELTDKLKNTFSGRLQLVGLQGSYRRGEAHAQSDIDAVVILDTLSLEDLTLYKQILSSMPESDKACGFISGKQELLNWPKHELFQFVYDTTAFWGEMSGLFPEIEQEDIITSVKISASGLYHLCCHTFIHDYDNINLLKSFFKSAFFLLQALYYLCNDVYIHTKKELLPLIKEDEHKILEISMNWENYEQAILANPDPYYNLIFKWCANIINTTALHQL